MLNYLNESIYLRKKAIAEMHNMSNQLYKYITALIVDYFELQNIKPGERFNLYLENDNHVKGIYKSFSKLTSLPVISFNYTHPDGNGLYETFYIEVGETKVIVSSSTNASEDYFTMLRNQVAEQKGAFKDTAILILFSGKLDSLIGGSGSLLKEGMPLYYKNFKQKIIYDIDSSTSLNKHEKITLKEVLDRKTNSVVEDNNTIFDYSGVIITMSKGKIHDEDFSKLGLFKNSELETISDTKKIKTILSSTFELYENLENIFLQGHPEIELERLVSETGKQKILKADKWSDFEYPEIERWIDAKKKRVAPKFDDNINDDAFVKIWCRPEGDTVSKKRTKNIIIFNPSEEFPVNFELKCDQPTKTAGISVQNNKDLTSVLSSGNSLKVKIDGYNSDELFTEILYKDKETKKTYRFKILCLPYSELLLNKFENNYLISKEGALIIAEDNDEFLSFNIGSDSKFETTLLADSEHTINDNTELKLKIDYENLSEDNIISFCLNLEKFSLVVNIKPESDPPKPIMGIDVWKNKRQFESHYKFILNEDSLKLAFKNNEYHVKGAFRNNLLLEKQIIDSNGFSWEELSGKQLHSISLEISDRLKKSFNNLRDYYLKEKSLPSLMFLKDELKELAEEYVDVYYEELNKIEEDRPLQKSEKDLVLLGVIQEKYSDGLIKYSPLHPINIAYQLNLNGQLKQEEIYNAILKRLNPSNLIPYIELQKNKVFTQIDSIDTPEWISYSKMQDSEQAAPKDFVSKLVTTKIENFTYNFDFLFSQSKYSPIKLNVVNLGDCEEVVQGLFEYYKRYLNKHLSSRPSDLLTIDINIYGSDQLVSKFEELSYFNNVEDIESRLKINLKTSNFEKEDLLNIFLEKVNFYSKPIPKSNEKYEYSHITFYQFNRVKSGSSSNKPSQVKSGLSLNGLMADIPSTPIAEIYKSGFGSKDLPSDKSTLIKLVCLYNSAMNVVANEDNYEVDKAICTTINFQVKEKLENLYINSQWVTFIDPKVDLDFFQEEDDLVIIHYSDQFNNSSGYDSITVSRKTSQYANIVAEFLTKNKVEYNTSTDTIKVINFFNAINGDWLLKLIRQDSQFPREKISLLSGIKLALTFLYTPNIIWVPVSLEEILRVSGSAGLNMQDGLFSTKNLRTKESSFSDDLLMIGLERRENGVLQMHLYPIELKIGGSNLIRKGIEQGRRTAKLIREHVLKAGFLGEFYRNFFAKIALTSAEKMKLYNIWEVQNWNHVIDDFRYDLMNNNFIISKELDSKYGSFGVIHFGKESLQRRIEINEDYVLSRLFEEDGYNFLVKSIEDLIELFHKKETGIEKKNLLINRFLNNAEESQPVEEILNQPEEANDKIKIHSKSVEEIPSKIKEGIKVLFGSELKDDSKQVIWEPNNTDKVMHTNTGIIGTMGTGKTQFTKSLISQLVSNQDKNIGPDKLGVLIFDYKGDYIKDDFVNATSAKVYNPFHLPYNPLALDATEQSKPMLPLHTANDIKETISNAFNLGNVQKQKLRDAIIEAYEAKGIYKAKRNSWTLPPPTVGDVCDIYMQDEKVAQDSLYAAISNLQDFEIFEPDVSKTKSLYDLVEGVTVINLSGYDESIQNLIVAITLDAFYTQMQTHGHSIIKDGKRQIKKMILVDEADNFLSKNFNSIKKILKEGREFGVGTVLSTQFLNHFSTSENDYSNYILTWVIHRVSEIKTKEVESLFSIESRDQRDNLIKTIKGLEKHQSIVNLAGSSPILIKDKAFWELLKAE
ncbi:DNA phosphorothioation-dependent restriction protein DptH [Maribacter forsetii]|uniref:DNA phosphorothioation-dependent restriction protein DptH n=1 Tax=Maribacter forsetii TaxID=444515 RepID=UPI001427C7D1|nr:DNA phosphorothioation-dependent restriction protein DptH [Maribacter forsetii]